MNEYKDFHLFCGSGGAALGFKQTVSEYRGMVGKFRCLGGIDSDPDSCRDFEMLLGVPASQMDLFTREDYISFHDQEPPEGWREATPGDILEASGGEYPDVVFLSPPCKGFSGLLPAKKAESEKYQALNNLVVRGLKLTLEAFADDLPAVIMLENVPRITSRGEFLLKQVKRLLGKHGYVFHEGFHDCGEIGGLGQHRKRYLLIARLPDKMPSFIYKPAQRKVKSIGEVIGPLAMPDDPNMGPMHRLPRLKWLTWVRLALIPAGGDWRDLEKLDPGQYHLEHLPRSGVYQVADWNEPAGTVVGSARVGGSNGVAAVADPRLPERNNRHPAVYQVVKWDESGPCVTGTRFGSGAPAIADPRAGSGYSNKRKVLPWDELATTVTGTPDIQSGAQSIADPRTGFKDGTHAAIYRVGKWEDSANTVTGANRPNNGAPSVADPRMGCRPRNGTMGVQDWNRPGATVIGAGDIHAGAAAVADPRLPGDHERPDPPPVIISLDGTWHRPLTTLELAALQGFPVVLDDGRPFILAGKSDSKWRGRIGNAVPPPAARAVGEQILTAFLMSQAEEWTLSATGIWVQEPKGSEDMAYMDDRRNAFETA